jgi:hypothetical protein
MVTERFYNCTAVDCKCNVHEFISTGEGSELTRLENMYIPKLNSGMNVWMGQGNRG